MHSLWRFSTSIEECRYAKKKIGQFRKWQIRLCTGPVSARMFLPTFCEEWFFPSNKKHTKKPARPVVSSSHAWRDDNIVSQPGASSHGVQAARASQTLGHYLKEWHCYETCCENGSKVKRQKHTGAQRPLRFLSGVLCLSSASKRIPSTPEGHLGELGPVGWRALLKKCY